MLLLFGKHAKGAQYLVDLNCDTCADPKTGFKAMHIAVANGLKRMVDFLSELPNMPECAAWAHPHSSAPRTLTRIRVPSSHCEAVVGACMRAAGAASCVRAPTRPPSNPPRGVRGAR